MHTHGVELHLTKLTPRPVVPDIHPEGTARLCTCATSSLGLRLRLRLRLRLGPEPQPRPPPVLQPPTPPQPNGGPRANPNPSPNPSPNPNPALTRFPPSANVGSVAQAGCCKPEPTPSPTTNPTHNPIPNLNSQPYPQPQPSPLPWPGRLLQRHAPCRLPFALAIGGEEQRQCIADDADAAAAADANATPAPLADVAPHWCPTVLGTNGSVDPGAARSVCTDTCRQARFVAAPTLNPNLSLILIRTAP